MKSVVTVQGMAERTGLSYGGARTLLKHGLKMHLVSLAGKGHAKVGRGRLSNFYVVPDEFIERHTVISPVTAIQDWMPSVSATPTVLYVCGGLATGLTGKSA